jgi:hypothetical protein
VWCIVLNMIWFVFSSAFIVIVMLYCSYSLQFVILIRVCYSLCIHAVDEVSDSGILIFLWMTRIVVYDQICRYVFSNTLIDNVFCKFVKVKTSNLTLFCFFLDSELNIRMYRVETF